MDTWILDVPSLLTDAIALIALTAMEIVLGIDNIVFVSISSSRLPLEQQARARLIGLSIAMGLRIALLTTLSWIMGLATPAFSLSSLGLFTDWLHSQPNVNQVTWKDVILLCGGLYLIRSSVTEIHDKVEGGSDEARLKTAATLPAVIVQICLLDVVFSLDSIITAIGMAQDLWIMIIAVVIAVVIMMVFAGVVSRFVEKYPTIKMLAFAFLLMIGVMLVAEAIGSQIDKRFIYFAMAFSLFVEVLNLRMKAARARKAAGSK
jgi:predicted tellurium resistance membrane protein TerC